MNIEIGNEFKQVKKLKGYPYNRMGESWTVFSFNEVLTYLRNRELGLGVNKKELAECFELVMKDVSVENVGINDEFTQVDYYYEHLPSSFNTIIKNKKGEILDQQHNELEGEKYKVIFNGDVTIVILSDGSKGVSKRNPRDTYNSEIALTIAFKRAMIESLKKDIKTISKTMKI